jgi:hypothetical protein
VIPRVARSGRSFQGAGKYYLHDKANPAFQGIGDYALSDKGDRSTSYRVGFTEILNMEAETPAQAIEQMSASYDAYRAREANKRGRKLTQPVYVYSLAWSPEQSPDKDEMLAAARSSLKALRLEGLQTLIVQHTDEPQPHIHVIVNRIERDGSRARNIPFDKLRFSKWAEEYEREHGRIFCEKRVENNARRERGEFVVDSGSLTRKEHDEREKAESFDVAKWRRQQDAFRKSQHKYQRDVLWAKHARERGELEKRTRNSIYEMKWKIYRRFGPEWSRLYLTQGHREFDAHLASRRGIFERAVFLYSHRAYLNSVGRPLKAADIFKCALSGKALKRRVQQAHSLERAALAKWKREVYQAGVRRAWQEHHWDFIELQKRQVLERDGLAHVQMAEWENELRDRRPQPEKGAIEVAPVKAPELHTPTSHSPAELDAFFADVPKLTDEFKVGSRKGPSRSRSDDIEKRMMDYKKKNPNRDFGREL